MKLFKTEGFIRTVLHIELLLLFSLAGAWTISFILKKNGFFPEPDFYTPNQLHSNLYANYRVLSNFTRLTENDFVFSAGSPAKSSEVIIPETGSEPELIIQLLTLQKARLLLDEKKYDEANGLLNKLETPHDFLKPRFYSLRLRALYFLKQYAAYVDLFVMRSPKDDLNARLLLVNSLEKIGKTDKAFAEFRELFKTRRIQSMEALLGRPLVLKYLGKISYDDWLDKFMRLAEKNDYSGFVQEKKYSRAPQLALLTEAEFKYRAKQYSVAEKILEQVSAPELQTHREKILLKIAVRRGEHDNLVARAAAVRADADIYAQLLFDAASIALIHNNPGVALSCYSQYIGHMDQTPNLRENDENYWKALWLSAWISLRQKNKDDAITFFRKTTTSPMESYSTAAKYWFAKLRGEEPSEIVNTPFSYYYTKTSFSKDSLRADTLSRFVSLLNGIQGVYFKNFLGELNLLLQRGFTDDAFAYARYAAGHNFLNESEKNLFKLIEPILYWRKGDFYRAYAAYRENFKKYSAMRPPTFLAGLVIPVKYRDLIEKYSKEYNLDPYFVMALIREESFYRPAIVSPAQANGLMQLILPTARLVAARLGDKRIELRDLYDPETNIRLGTAHLRELLEIYNNKYHLVLAAYNAGPLRVQNWNREFGDAPDDMYIEMIPFTETRTYVKNILRNYYYYKFYYGG